MRGPRDFHVPYDAWIAQNYQTNNEGKVYRFIYYMTANKQDRKDAIAITQFQNGIISRKTGALLHPGCGVTDEGSIKRAIRGLVKKGHIKTSRRQSEEGEDLPTLYWINLEWDEEEDGLEDGVEPHSITRPSTNVRGAVSPPLENDQKANAGAAHGEGGQGGQYRPTLVPTERDPATPLRSSSVILRIEKVYQKAFNATPAKTTLSSLYDLTAVDGFPISDVISLIFAAAKHHRLTAPISSVSAWVRQRLVNPSRGETPTAVKSPPAKSALMAETGWSFEAKHAELGRRETALSLFQGAAYYEMRMGLPELSEETLPQYVKALEACEALPLNLNEGEARQRGL